MQVTRERRRFRLSFSFVAKATLVVVLMYALVSGIWLARDIIFIGFLAVLFAAFLSIFVEWLEPYLPRWAATILVFLVLLLVLTGFFFLAWPALSAQIGTIRREVPQTVEAVAEWVEAQAVAVAGDGAPREQFRQHMNQRLGTEAANIVAGALPLLNTVLGAVAGLLLVVFTGLFLAVNPGMYLRGFLAMVPQRGRQELRSALEDAGRSLRRWIGGMSISMLVIFLFTTAGLWLLDVPAFLALGLIAGLLVFIPFVGPILSAIPAMALGLTVSPLMMLWVGLLYLAVQQLESNALMPIIMKRAVDLPPALMLLFQMAMSVLFGFIGLLVAVPLLAVTKVLVERLYVERLEQDPEHDGAAVTSTG